MGRFGDLFKCWKIVMAKEIERRFLVDSTYFYNYIDNNKLLDIFLIEQTYFDNPQFRVRRKTSIYKQNDTKYYITVKKGKGLVRDEFEQRIDNNIGLYLLESQKTICKERYATLDGWEIDHFINPMLSNLWIAEYELDTENEEIILPNYIDEEITGKEKYSNYELWKKIN